MNQCSVSKNVKNELRIELGMCLRFCIDFRLWNKWFRCFTKTKIIKDTETVAQKSKLRFSELMAQYHHALVWIGYQNPTNLNEISTLKTYLKQDSSFDAILVSTVLQNVTKKIPKCLVGTVANTRGATLITSSGVFGPEDTVTGPQGGLKSSRGELDPIFFLRTLFWHQC